MPDFAPVTVPVTRYWRTPACRLAGWSTPWWRARFR